MKNFDLLRYLKKWAFLIVLIMAAGCFLVYQFISSNQSYTATAVIQYTNSQASSGLNADGSKIDPTEITSASVINKTIEQLGLTASTESIRSHLTVSEVVSEDEETRKEATLSNGDEYEYHPTVYQVSFTVNEKGAEEYARNVLDSILSNYFDYYGETHVNSDIFPNNAVNVSVSNYEYIDCVEMLRSNANESVAYLNKKADEKYGFYSVKTGYSFSDLVASYEYLTNNGLNDLYAYIINHKLVKDHNVLVDNKSNIVLRYQLQIDSLQDNLTKVKGIIDQFGDKTLDGSAVYQGNRNADGSETQIITDVVNGWESSSIQAGRDVTTTYDKLIQHYADLQTSLIDTTNAQGQTQEILDIYKDVTANTDPSCAEAQWASNRIDELASQFTNLYNIALETISEFNQVIGASNIDMKSSVVVTEKLNLKLYTMLAVVLFLFVGCFFAIFLGRLGDFVDYYLYVDKKTGLPNRERCDDAIEYYSSKALGRQFCCIVLQLDLTVMSRSGGDTALKIMGDRLQYIFRSMGFVGYNGAGRFIIAIDHCNLELAQNCLDRLTKSLEKVDTFRFEKYVFIGLANSSKDGIYSMRELLRLALTRCNEDRQNRTAQK